MMQSKSRPATTRISIRPAVRGHSMLDREVFNGRRRFCKRVRTKDEHARGEKCCRRKGGGGGGSIGGGREDFSRCMKVEGSGARDWADPQSRLD